MYIKKYKQLIKDNNFTVYTVQNIKLFLFLLKLLFIQYACFDDCSLDQVLNVIHITVKWSC